MTNVTNRVDRLYNKVAGRLPPRIAGAIDWRRPELLQSWGGPLNGQRERQSIIRDIAKLIDFALVVETGTYRGSTTEFLGQITGARVETVEASQRYFEFSRRRFSAFSNINTHLGDSRTFLRQLAKDATILEQNTLFYLDAHWQKDLPLAEELDIIAAAWSRSVIVIDDFEVAGDDGYAFDDYGPGRKLTADYLPDLPNWNLFYPAARSGTETGAKRGAAFLVSVPLLDQILQVRSLRKP